MAETCYNCGDPLTDENKTVEHVPAKNMFDGFDPSYKQNRITVPACLKCNNDFSKIDQELRDFLAVKNESLEERKQLTEKGIRSILRRPNWVERSHVKNGQVVAVEFKYDDLKQIHIKHFKALFYRKYGFPLPSDYIVDIITEGDDHKMGMAQMLHDYIRDGKEFEVSGHSDIFKFIIKDFSKGKNDTVVESGDLEKAFAIGGLMIYHDDIVAIVMTSKKAFVEGQER